MDSGVIPFDFGEFTEPHLPHEGNEKNNSSYYWVIGGLYDTIL
jgi:hypothetical protein